MSVVTLKIIMSSDETDRPRRALVGMLLLFALVATAVSVWWLVGDLDEFDGPDADFMIPPPDLSSSAERWIGGSALVLLVGTLFALGAVLRTSGASRNRRIALLLVVIAGAIIGAGYRVMTAAVVGANIGGGLVLMFGGPLLAFLLVRAGQLAHRGD